MEIWSLQSLCAVEETVKKVEKEASFGCDLEQKPIPKVYAVPSNTYNLSKWYFESWLVID